MLLSRLIISAILLIAADVAVASSPHVPSKPNIVLVLLDDMGFSDLSCYGGEIDTPTLDRLATEGIRFSQFYVASKCEPTRASLMTGHYWPIAGTGYNKGAQHGATLGEVLKTVGYRTFAIGKWHLKGSPENRGFDRAFGHLSGASDYFRLNNTFHLDGERFQDTVGNPYLTDLNTDYGIQFIEEERQSYPESPFFLYIAYNAPHAPLQAREEDIAKYRGRFAAGWDSLRQARFERQHNLGLVRETWGLPERPQNIPAWSELDEQSQAFEQRRMEVYAAMIDRVDQNLARLLSRLEEMGIADNTLVLVMSDNGAADKDNLRTGKLGTKGSHWNTGLGWAYLSNTPFRYYKRSQHAGGIASPLIAWWPKGIAPRDEWEDSACHVTDLMPTLMELTGAGYPSNKPDLPPLPGVSLLPLLAGQRLSARPPLFFALKGKDAVIDNGWKLVRGYNQGWELFDLEADRTESRDVLEAEPEKTAELLSSYRKWVATMGLKLDRQDEAETKYVPLYDEQGKLLAPRRFKQNSKRAGNRRRRAAQVNSLDSP